MKAPSTNNQAPEKHQAPIGQAKARRTNWPRCRKCGGFKGQSVLTLAAERKILLKGLKGVVKAK